MENLVKMKNEMMEEIQKNEMNNDKEILNRYSNLFCVALSFFREMESCGIEIETEIIKYCCHKFTDYFEFEIHYENLTSDLFDEIFQNFIAKIEIEIEEGRIIFRNEKEKEAFEYFKYQTSYFYSDNSDSNESLDKEEFENLFCFI